MSVKIFDAVLDLVIDRGIATVAGTLGLVYLVKALSSEHSEPNTVLVGLALVLLGAVFQYLAALAKLRYIERDTSAERRDINAMLAPVIAALEKGREHVDQNQKAAEAATEQLDGMPSPRKPIKSGLPI